MKIKSNINNKNNILEKTPITTPNDYSIDIEDNSDKLKDDPKVNKFDKVKELLQKLLKQSLDQRLTTIDKKSKNQMIAIKNTLKTTYSITDVAIDMNKQIQEKLKKDKKKQSKFKTNKYSSNKKQLSPHKATNNSTRTNNFKVKTPSHINKTVNNSRGKSLMGIKRELIKNKPNMTLIRASKTIQVDRDRDKSLRGYNTRQKSRGNRAISNNNIKKIINYNDDSNLDDLQTISVASIKTNKTNTHTLNSLNNSRAKNKYPFLGTKTKQQKENTPLNLKNSKIQPQKNNISDFNLSEKNLIHITKKKTNNSNLNTEEKKKRKKTPFTKKNKNNENESFKINNSSIKKKEKTIEDEIDDILFMEYNLQKEAGLNDNDPLLILPLKDLDFVPKGLLRRNSVRADNTKKDRKYGITSFNIQENLQKIKFNNILKYLSINDLLLVKNLSKKFHRIIILYLIENLEKEKKNITNIKGNLNINETTKREGFENFVLSKGGKKAIILLNEPELSCLFKTIETPFDEIILIYRIYFQMINHPFALIAKTDIDNFWEKCRYYFLNEQNGKAGDVLMTMINEKKIDVKGNNLYQIYNLVKGNLDKMLPNYYSNKCGTTGLFVFIIKEILEYLGISQKIKKKENAYWTYTDIIDCINEKINYLKINKI